MKKLAIGTAIILILTQIVLIVLHIMHIIDLSIPWLISPAIAAVFLGTIFMVWFVLDAERNEK
mgnify:CR=1 FL=1